MTWQTAAVRFVSIGERSARFRDLVLPFDVDGEPVETVVWLPNGGGKSSMMSLKSAVVLPGARDFTGAGREDREKRPRRLDDYVISGDTSHTVIEWTADDNPTLLGNRNRLLTGAVYEWPERRRPSLEQDSKLNKMWWSAVPEDGILDLTHLPVRDGRLLTLTQFRDRLRALNLAHPELQVRMAQTQNQWEEQLGELGIDTALYRYQARMNTSEGGIAKVFNFNTERDFINLVVDVIAAPEQAADCAKVVNQHARNLFRKPTLLVERAFLTDAHTLLSDLEAAHELVQDAAAAREQAHAVSARLRSALTLAADLRDTVARVAAAKVEQLGEAASEARRERGRIEGVRAELLYLAAVERRAAAARGLDAAKDAESTARRDHGAWSAAAPLAEASGHDAVAGQLREQLKPERAAREDLRVRLDTLAVAAQLMLGDSAAALDKEAARAAGQARTARDRITQIGGHLTSARTEAGELDRAAAKAEGLLEEHDKSLIAARKSGLLGTGETPAQARERHHRAAADAEAAAGEHTESENRHRAAAREARALILAAATDHTQLSGDARAVAQDEQRLRRAHDRLAGHLRLVALAEAEATVDPWGDAARLRAALTDAARDADAAGLREAVESAEDDRLIGGVDTSGLFPAPVATDAVADRLTNAGLVAETAWTVLARDYPEISRQHATDTRPDVVSGVVVQDDTTRDRALALLSSDPTLAHIPIVTADELARTTRGELGIAPLASVPLHPGLHGPDAAAAAAAQMRVHAQTRRERVRTFSNRATGDRTLLSELSDFLTEYPDSDSLTRASHLTETTRDAAVRKLAEKGQLEDEHDTHERLAAEERAHAVTQQDLVRDHASAATTAKALHESEGRLETHRETIAVATRKLTEVNGRIEDMETERRELGEQVTVHDLTHQSRRSQATVVRDQLGEIAVIDPDTPPPDGGVHAARSRGLTECLAGYATLQREWQAASTASVLEAQLVGAEEGAKAARQRAGRILNGLPDARDEVFALAQDRATRHTSAACDVEAIRAGEALETAVGGVVAASTGLKEADKALAEATDTRSRAQRVTEPVEFTTVADAEVRAETLTEEVTRLTSAETRLLGERDRADAEAKEAGQLAESLRDLATRLPTTTAGRVDLTDVTAYLGDLAAARIEVTTAVRRVSDTSDEVVAAQQARAEQAKAALKLATSAIYQDLTLSLRVRLADSDTATLSAKAAEYRVEVTLRLTQVEDLLSQIGTDEDRVSRLVATHVRQLLSGIAGAARASKLPAGLGELSGKQFINLRFTNPSDDELGSRVTQEILAMLDRAHGDSKSLPSGEAILRHCVHAAVGVKGFRVDVLKPNEHMLAQQVPVTDVARFSDGEKLTTCVLLFCAFARMRQQHRSGGATGTLMLDNPFGRASNAQLVALQLAVAKAQRVHLVYATGLEDMGALLQFRRLIRLRNRKPVGSTDGHVQLEAGGRIGEVSGVSVARPSAPVPAGLDGDTSPHDDVDGGEHDIDREPAEDAQVVTG